MATAEVTTGEAPDEAEDALTPRAINRRGAIGAFDWGVAAAAGVSLVYGILDYPVGLTWGLIAVGVVGGWVIGAAVARGAWRGEPHLPDRRLRLWAAALGLISWLGGMFVAYVASGLLFPAANTPLTERITFGDYIAGTYDIAHGAATVVMVVVSWRSAR
jgi:hypothetical protein